MTQTSSQQDSQPVSQFEDLPSADFASVEATSAEDFLESNSVTIAPLTPDGLSTSTVSLGQWWSSLNLRYKAMAAAIAIGMVPAILVGGIAYGVVNHSLSQQVHTDANGLETSLEDRYRDVKRQLQLSLLLGTLAASALVAVVARLAAEQATRPVRQIVGAVKRIGEGDLDTRLEVRGQDEFAMLSANINAMTQQLKELAQEQALSVEQANLIANIAGSSIPDKRALEQAFNQALEGVQKILKTERVVIYQFNADRSGRIAYECLESGYKSAHQEVKSDPCFPESLREAYQKGRIVTSDDLDQDDLHPEHRHLLERLQVRANAIVPLFNQGEIFGLLIAHHCDRPHTWQETEITFLKQVAEQLSITLDRVSLQQQRRDDARRAQLLKDITLKIAGALNGTDVFKVAVDELRRAMKVDRVLVFRFSADWRGTIVAESVAAQFPVALDQEMHDPCFAERYAEKYKQGRVQATPNIYEAGLTPCHIKQLEPLAVKANIVAPIVHKDILLGLLVAHQCSGPRYWEQTEVDFFAQVATQIGFALERATLLEGQRRSEEDSRQAREKLQQRALELLMEVDPVSRGDLTIRAHVTEDEIGTIADSYNATIESLRKIVTQVLAASGQVAFTTNANEASIRSLSQEAVSQAADIAAALEKLQAMTESIRAVAANAELAEVTVQQATQTVESGEEAMNRTVDGIMAIRETVAETAKKVKRLGESSQKISKVVNLIGSFADQTNLLALNASIEAAHAGEEGRGFAVVADEVRSLARQSAEATAEIASLVASIQSETNEVVAAMEAGTEQVVAGTKLVDETRKSLNQITAASAQITELVEAIAKAAIEQSQTSQAVTQTMVQVAAVSDKTSSEAAQVSDSFKQLLAVAQSLQESVSQFKVS